MPGFTACRLLFQRPEVWDEEHDDGEDGYRQNRADLEEVEEAVAAGRVDEDAGRLQRREERAGGGVGDSDGEGARVQAERERRSLRPVDTRTGCKKQEQKRRHTV